MNLPTSVAERVNLYLRLSLLRDCGRDRASRLLELSLIEASRRLREIGDSACIVNARVSL
jgi:hypothetical protein